MTPSDIALPSTLTATRRLMPVIRVAGQRLSRGRLRVRGDEPAKLRSTAPYRGARQPSRSASATLQNHRSPRPVSIRVLAYEGARGEW